MHRARFREILVAFNSNIPNEIGAAATTTTMILFTRAAPRINMMVDNYHLQTDT